MRRLCSADCGYHRTVGQWIDAAASAPFMAELMRAGHEGVRVWPWLWPQHISTA